MTAALRAEWTKLRSVRSTLMSVVGLVAVSVLFSAVICSTTSTSGGPGNDDVVAISLAGLYFGQLFAVALGVLAIGSEYGTGTIRTTFAADPRRLRVVLAKAALVGSLVVTVGLAAAVGSFLVGQELLPGQGYVAANGYPPVSLANSEAIESVGIATAYLGLVALFAFCVAAVTRHSASAVGVVLGVLLLPLIVAVLVPRSLGSIAEKSSPMVGLAGIDDNAPIDQLPGLAVSTAWAVGSLVLALWLVRRRDT